MDAVILAAGLGTRLRPMSDSVPKPLIPVGGRGTLPRLLTELPAAVDRIILVVGHLEAKIGAAVGDLSGGRPVTYVSQSPLNGTGGAVLQSRSAIQSHHFLVLNGDDIYVRTDLEALVLQTPSYLIREMMLPRRMASCVLSEDRLIGFRMVPRGSHGTVICGAYCLSRSFFDTDFAPVPGNASELSLPHTLLRRETVEHHLPVRASLWLPCGTPQEIFSAEAVLQSLCSDDREVIT